MKKNINLGYIKYKINIYAIDTNGNNALLIACQKRLQKDDI